MSGETDLLENFKQPKESSLTVNDINNYDFGLTPDEKSAYDLSQEQFNPASSPRPNDSYYPNLHDPIGVGQSSGRIIGSQTQYVPGGAVVPIGMWDARDAAVQKAAMAKAKDVADWKAANMAKAPTSKLTNINENITNEFFKYQNDAWNQALKSNKGDASKAAYALKNNADYQAKNKAFYDQAKGGDAVFEQKVKLMQDAKEGKTVITPMMQESINYLTKTENPNSEEFKNTSNAFLGFTVARDFNDSFNTVLDKLKQEKASSIGIDPSNPDYYRLTDFSEEGYTPEQQQYAKQSMYKIYGADENGNGGRLGEGYITKEQIDKNIEGAMSARKIEKSQSIQNKPKEGNGLDEMITEDKINKEASVRNVDNTVKGGTSTEQFAGIYGQTLQKPIKNVQIAAGTEMWDIDGGNNNYVNTTSKGVKNVTIGGAEIVDVIDAPGTVQNNRIATEQWKQRNAGKGAKTKKMAMAVATYEQNVESKDAMSGMPIVEKKVVTTYVPVKSVSNAIQKKSNGKYAGGINVDLINKQEADLNSGKDKSSANLKVVPLVGTPDDKRTVAVKSNESKKTYTKEQLNLAKQKNPGVSEQDLINALENR